MAKLKSEPVDLLQLVHPSKSHLTRAKRPGLLKAGAHYWDVWLRTIADHENVGALRVEYTCPGCGTKHELTGSRLWARLVRNAGAYCSLATRQLFGLPGGWTGLLSDRKSEWDEVVTQLRADPDTPPEVSLASDLALTYHLCLLLLAIDEAGILGEGLSAEVMAKVMEFFGNVQRTTAVSELSGARDLAATLLHDLLGVARLRFSRSAAVSDPHHHAGAYSALRLSELSMIAGRREAVERRYGKKQLEKVFEEQLALLLKTFGLIVTRTRVGERTVDLVCVSGDPADPMTVLVEAKTSRRPYGLPVADQRALQEYVADVRRNLSTLPPLRFVLLVAADPAAVLEERMQALEPELGTPFRFCAARDLAAIRERAPGTPRFGDVADILVGGPTIVGVSMTDQLAERYRDTERAHAHLIRTMLTGAKTPKELPSWDEHPEAEPC